MLIFILVGLISLASFSLFAPYSPLVSKSVFDSNVYIYGYLLGNTEKLFFVYSLIDFVVFKSVLVYKRRCSLLM
jgi:hypothetical protein